MTASARGGVRVSVSVVIPTYNRAAMLREALQSVRWQTVKDVEIIVVDDGSTDETAQVIEAFQPGMTVLRQVNQGVAAARNLGIRHASAPLIAFLDADDLWLPHKLERQLDYLHQHPEIGLLYARLWSYDIDNPRQRRLDPPGRAARSFRELLNGPNTVTTSTVVVRRECFEVAGLFNPSLRASEDHELWLRIARRFTIGFLDEPLAEYRRKTNGINSNPHLLFEGYRGFYDILLREYRPYLHHPRAVERQLAKFEYLCGTAALRRGERRSALKLIQRALARDAALGRQFVRKDAPWHVKVWLPVKPYAALTVSALQAMGKN